jgi:hypothetical protein
LEGLENHNSINYLGAIYCNLQSLNGLKGTTGIKYITISNNSNLQNLAGLEKDKLLETIYASDCDITDISMLNYTEDGTSYAKTALTSIKLENNSNLSDIKSIKVCSKITSCYLKGSGELDTTVLSSTEFQTIIKKCGIRYSLDDVYSLLFLNSEKVSLTDSYGVLTDEKLELLRGKTNIKSLDLSNQGSLSNEKLVSVLGSLTGLNCLKLYNVTGLTSVSFMSELKYLIELDLRGTSVTDLSPLETLAEKEKLPLGCLIIDNDGIHVYDIQKTISSVCEKYTGTDFSLNKDGGALPKGFILSNNKNFSDFAQCENIKYFRVYNTIAGSSGKTSDLVSGTIDLRNCLELYIVGTRAYNATFLLPKTLKYYSGENYYTPNLSGNDSMIDFHVSWSGCDLSSVMYDLRNDSQLMYFSANWLWGNASLTNIACLNNTKVTNLTCYSMTGLKGISLDEEVPKITEIDFHSSSKFNSLEGFNYFTNLVALNMNDTIISSLQPLSDLKSLATLKIENTKVNSLSPLLNCTSLVTINSSGTQLSDLNGVQKLTALQTLDVSNNESISNLYYLKLLLENNETISLKTLNLSGCNLENGETITVDGEKVYVDNLQIIKALKAKGLENIDISYNNITDEETLSEIAGLGWKSCNISHQGE